MYRDPKYYLDKAKYFNRLAKSNGYDQTSNTNDDSEYEYVKIEPTGTTSPVVAQVQPQYRRYWDPVKKHYFKIDKIFEDDANVVQQAPPPKDPDIWYPQNKLSYQFVRDPETGELYRASKNYDANGNYYHTYDKMNYCPERVPGTNYYRPLYRNE